jgi:Pyruvate/2-oxoacid:ferredoxin oxidoreductase gamma subunit
MSRLTIATVGHTGDGIQFLGRVLAEAAGDAGLQPVLLAEPGIAMRGDLSICRVTISDTPTLLPGAPDWLLATRPGPYPWPEATSIVDADRVRNGRLSLPATTLAHQAGWGKGAPLVLLGALSTQLDWLTEAILQRTLKERLADQPRQITLNMACFRAGRAAGLPVAQR